MITVFYDGKCGVCRKEIQHYQKVAPPGKFEWVDITVTPEPFEALGYEVIDGLKYFHVRDDQGQMHVGADAFIIIWQALARWRVLAFFVGLPGIRHIVQFVYRIFAHQRFKKMGYCDLERK